MSICHLKGSLVNKRKPKVADPSPRCWCCEARWTDARAVSSLADSWSELPESRASLVDTELKRKQKTMPGLRNSAKRIRALYKSQRYVEIPVYVLSQGQKEFIHFINSFGHKKIFYDCIFYLVFLIRCQTIVYLFNVFNYNKSKQY